MVSSHDGVTVVCAEDCGNAPRKELIRNFNIASAAHDLEYIMEVVTEDVEWEMIGRRKVKGKHEIQDAFKQLSDYRTAELHIHNIVTHGYTCAANGVLTMTTGVKYAFCDVYRFNSAGKQGKIKEIASYVIRINA